VTTCVKAEGYAAWTVFSSEPVSRLHHHKCATRYIVCFGTNDIVLLLLTNQWYCIIYWMLFLTLELEFSTFSESNSNWKVSNILQINCIALHMKCWLLFNLSWNSILLWNPEFHYHIYKCIFFMIICTLLHFMVSKW
jgi:hypothetical protein